MSNNNLDSSNKSLDVSFDEVLDELWEDETTLVSATDNKNKFPHLQFWSIIIVLAILSITIPHL